MATTNFTLRIDETDKQNAEQVFKSLGMTLSTGINVYLKAVCRQQKIPFELALYEQDGVPATPKTWDEKREAFMALKGIMAGHEVDLDELRYERILSAWEE